MMNVRLWQAFLLSLVLWFSQFATAAIPKVTTRIDAKNFYYSFKLIPTSKVFRVYLDTDSLPETGFRIGNIGANFMIENGKLFRYSGHHGKSGWTPVKNVAFRVDKNHVQFRVAKADIGNPKAMKVLARCANSRTVLR
jgi:hypothetical protein